MPEYAQIECKHIYHPAEGYLEQMKCRWVGDQTVAEVSQRLLFPTSANIAGWAQWVNEDTLLLGGLRLRVIDPQEPGILIRVTQDGWRALYLRRYYRLQNWGCLIYARLLHTARLWNLATFQNGEIPSWRDLHIFRRKQ